MNWFSRLLPPKIRSLAQQSRTPDPLWTKCTTCAQMIFQKDLESFLFVCRHCGHHMPWPIEQRLAHMFGGTDTYHLLPLPKVPLDPLQFRDQKKYQDRLKDARQKTGHGDALVVASGQVQGMKTIAACFDFRFIGGSMGIAVGEGLIMAAQQAADQRAMLILVPSSGGARMQEGIFSLMQMPRSTIAVRLARQAGVPVVVWLAHPTTGGVAASFAALGDLTIAEPGAIIGFTGARVIQETLRQPLPAGFQTAEFQKDHGFVDSIVPRAEVLDVFANLQAVFTAKRPFAPVASPSLTA